VASLDFLGESFEIVDRVGVMPMLRFAKAAKSGLQAESMDGLAAIYDVVEQCLEPTDWQRFETFCDQKRVDTEQLLEFVAKVMERVSERPTQRQSNSSDGQPTIVANSTDDASSRVIRRFEEKGRPDLALLVLKTVEAKAG
jgi:hypothetical protein